MTQERWHRPIGWLLIVLSVSMVIFHFANILRPTLPPVEAANVHLTFGLALVYLDLLRKARDRRSAAWLLLLLGASMAVSGYVAINYEALEDRIGLATPLDTAIGIVSIVCVLEATRRTFGNAIPIFTLGMLLYAYFGPYMPGFLQHTGFSFVRLIGNVTTYLTGTYGSLLQISTTVIAIFMLFGGFLSSSGASNFFVKLALRLGQRLSSGPAQAAVVASALFGMVNGSPVANVSTTGIFTIPLMKRHGYEPKFAGAVEATASTGGTLMPPVMGVSAFLMASITGIPYSTIALHAAIPGLIYFIGVGFAVHLHSKRLGLQPKPLLARTDPGLVSLVEGSTFFVPFVLIVTLMMLLYPVGYTALLGTLILMALMVLRGVIYGFKLLPAPSSEVAPIGAAPAARVEHSEAPAPSTVLGQFIAGSLDGAQGAARIGVVCATLGIVIHSFTMTGLAGRIVHNMAMLTGGNLFNALLIVAGVALLFGMGVPTAGSYVIVAILGAPILTGLNVPLLTAHLFVLYFTMLSALTPPVAAAVLVASQIARAGYWETAVPAIRLAIPGMLIPFLYVWEPGVLGIGTPYVIVSTVLAVIAGLYAFTAAFEGFLIEPCRLYERLLLFAAAAALLTGGVISDLLALAGAVPLLAVGSLHYYRRRLALGAGAS